MLINEAGREFIIKDTHRGLYYEDGKLIKVLEAGRHKIPPRRRYFKRLPMVECLLVDVRERELTIKGQEILTADKIAVRVSIIALFRVTDAQAAVHAVDSYEDRLYSDVQLAARRSLVNMTLEEILTNRSRLSEDILSDVTESVAGYGVAVRRADVKDLVFPANLQEIMNRVLSAERNSQVELIEARTRADVEEIEANSRADNVRKEAEAAAEARRVTQAAEADATRQQAEVEAQVYAERVKAADVLQKHPALIRMAELKSLRALAQNAGARLHLNFDHNGLRMEALEGNHKFADSPDS